MRPFTARVVADGRKAKTYPFDRKPAPLPQPPDNSVLAQEARERVEARARFDELGHIEVKKIFDDGHLPSIWVEHAKEWLGEQSTPKSGISKNIPLLEATVRFVKKDKDE